MPPCPSRLRPWALVLSTLVILLVAGCATGRKLPALSSTQYELLDSLPLFRGVVADGVDGHFRQHHCALKADAAGGNALRLHWWKGTNPAGRIAFPWSDGIERDLSVVEDIGGISLWLRRTGLTKAQPVIVLEMMDTRGLASEVTLAARHAEVFPLDTNWQEVRIPLSEFDRGREQTDWEHIEGFSLRMEHFGEILIRDWVLVQHQPRRKLEKRAAKRPLASVPEGRFTLFEDNADHIMGLGDFGDHRRFTIEEKRGRDKSMGLDLEWDLTPPPLSGQPVAFPTHTLGFSWNGWNPTVPPPTPERASIVFKLRNIGINQGPVDPLPIHVGLVDAAGRSSMIALTQDLIPGEGFGKWQECRIPFSAFEWATEAHPDGLGSLAFLFFRFEEKGHVHLDDVQVRF